MAQERRGVCWTLSGHAAHNVPGACHAGLLGPLFSGLRTPMPTAGFQDLTAIQRALVLTGIVVGVVLAGVVVILVVQKAMTRTTDDRGDWAKTLVGYKNLRDDGVLSDEEYRKIRTLVEPRSGTDVSRHPERRPAAGDDGGPARTSRT